MHPAAQDFQHFYASVTGRLVMHVLQAEYGALSDPGKQGRSLILGYAPALFDEAPPDGVIWGMPAEQGGFPWPDSDNPCSVALWEREMPFADLTFDRVVMVHELEFADGARPVLEECHRILRPNGELCLFVPNRNGIWARREVSPFARGNPYSINQLQRLIISAGFSPEAIYTTLFTPPSHSRWILNRTHVWEAFGRHVMPNMGGLVVCHARKDMLAASFSSARKPVRIEPLLRPALNMNCLVDQ